jgi:hypothetical protein
MMKATAALLVSLIIAPVAAAFVPSQSTTAASFSSSALRADPVGVAPFPGFLGKAEWNRLTNDFGSADTGTFVQAA